MCRIVVTDVCGGDFLIYPFSFMDTDKSSEFCRRNLKFMLYEKERDKERGARFS